ncbi:MAG: penicillin-binding protein 2 [Thermodesulfobacteriota bacterium]
MRNYRPGFVIATVILFLVTSVLLSRLWYLQVIRGREFEKSSRINHITVLRFPAPRGRILDRKGREIVSNRKSFDVYVNIEDVRDLGGLAAELAAITGMEPVEIEATVQNVRGRGRFKPVLITKDISRDQLALIEPRRSTTLRGVEIKVNHLRRYPYGPLGAQVLGYLGRVTGRELEADPKLRSNDLVGKAGVEKAFEKFLKGVEGFVQKPIDVLGRQVTGSPFTEDLRRLPSTPGYDLVLSIDLDLQREAAAALGDRPGAVVVMKVKTAEVLALVSSPAYNPQDFVTGIDPKKWRSLVTDKSHPLFNRTTQGLYAPGSVFKIVTAAAALEEGVVKPDTMHFCPGYHIIGSSVFMCWKRSGHGWVDIREALVQSCDVFFYKVAERLGIDRLSVYIREFGFGSPTGIGIAEKHGIAPSRQWKMSAKKRPWFRGDTIVSAIGQGYVSATPLQVAMMTVAVANGGRVMKPRLVNKIVDRRGEVVVEYKNRVLRSLSVSKDTLELIRASLEGVVNDSRGTGRAARLDEVVVAGKTGTSQVVSNSVKKKLPEYRDHAWFTSFAPSGDPEISVTVLVEHGGTGGAVAGPVAGRVIEYYFRMKRVAKRDSR